MIIDTHVHLFSCETLERELDNVVRTRQDGIALRNRYPEIHRTRFTEPALDNSDQLLAVMDRNHIRHAMVQGTRGRVTNEDVAAVVRKHPDRFFGLLRMRPDSVPGGYDEDPTEQRKKAPDIIAHGIENLGLKGVGETLVRALTRHIHPEDIAKDLKPIMDTLAYYKVPIQIMTAWTQFKGALYYGNPIWVDEVAGNHPDVPIILTKMGRGIGYYFDTALTVALRNENVYFDTVQTSGEHLRRALDAIGPHRIMFGTDWDKVWHRIRIPEDNHITCLKILDEAGVSPSEREAILWKTAAQVFRLNIPEAG